MTVEAVAEAVVALVGAAGLIVAAAWHVAERLSRVEALLCTLPCKRGPLVLPEEDSQCGRPSKD